jgi:hypothetical protein
VFSPSHPFQHVLQHNTSCPSCSNSIMFRPWGECLPYSWTNFPNLSIIFPNCLHNIVDVVWTTTSFNYRYPSMHVHTSDQPYGYPPLMLHPQ